MPPDPQEAELYELIVRIRACFNRLRTVAEGLHRDVGINPSMRAVMESLAARRGQSVPDIARSRGGSRQHVQTIVNALLAGGFVATVDNPAHRRSPLLDLTKSGRATFAEVSRREAAPLARIARDFPAAPLRAARRALAELEHRLDEELTRT